MASLRARHMCVHADTRMQACTHTRMALSLGHGPAISESICFANNAHQLCLCHRSWQVTCKEHLEMATKPWSIVIVGHVTISIWCLCKTYFSCLLIQVVDSGRL